MKTKNTSNQWRDTASLPHSGDWSWKPKKSKRARRKSTLAKSTKKVAQKSKPARDWITSMGEDVRVITIQTQTVRYV